MGKLVVSRSKLQPDKNHGRLPKFEPHEVAVQIPYCIHPEIPATAIVRGSEEKTRRSVSPRGGTQRLQDRRRPHHAGSCAYAHQHTAEAFRVRGDWLHQREKRDTRGPAFPETRTELCWAATVVTRLFRGHGWA